MTPIIASQAARATIDDLLVLTESHGSLLIPQKLNSVTCGHLISICSGGSRMEFAQEFFEHGRYGHH